MSVHNHEGSKYYIGDRAVENTGIRIFIDGNSVRVTQQLLRSLPEEEAKVILDSCASLDGTSWTLVTLDEQAPLAARREEMRQEKKRKRDSNRENSSIELR